ncbi:MAG: CDP-diacylglycerol--glycerol-3-phosphate 3-phosphatidyltransferase [Opitutae bacterium]|nr:CDP-diacylglycerol--glycerol-3-phosphate 3-phosphatidyltransferase [Opitutae bacterium]MBC9888894.1 CDP-diacylglycerol--glycerol-3-phosphate 3-phosphatidyltransferase [Opitutae bacterium]
MNLPNLLTLSRVPFLFFIAALLYWSFPFSYSLALVVFVMAGLTDWLDGKIARDRDMISVFGQLMDALTDKILTVGLFITFLAVGLLPDWMVIMVLFILSREFLITGLRMVAAAKNRVLPAERAGKIKTVFQIVSIGALISARAGEFDWLPLTGYDLDWMVSTCYFLGLSLFTVATIMTVYSGSYYMIKYGDLYFGSSSTPDRS